MSELKPCPFCGEEPEIFDFKDGRYLVECSNTNCDVYPYTKIHHDKADAITAWNQRAAFYTKPTTLSQLQADNAKLREQVDAAHMSRLLTENENESLRELVWDMWDFYCVMPDEPHVFKEELDFSAEVWKRMREMGVDE